MSPRSLITSAFLVSNPRLVAPEWTSQEIFEFEAVAPPGTPRDVRLRMLQTVLVERFGLKFHFEERQTDIYALTVGSSALKLTPSTGDPPQTIRYNPGEFKQKSASLANLAFYLSMQLSREVVDFTGLEGRFSFDLNWKDAYNDPTNITPTANGGGQLDPAIIMRAVKTTGLKLEPRKTAMKYLIVDSINKEPTPN